MSSKWLERMKDAHRGPMSPAELKVLRDMQAFVDFAIRNGLSFPLVMGTLAHDVNGLARYGFDLTASKSDFFLPRVTSYAELGPEDFGEPEEGDEPATRKRARRAR